eukprot:SAG11_NODE_260_length_11531_cov_6.271781_14_plen_48_part_00
MLAGAEAPVVGVEVLAEATAEELVMGAGAWGGGRLRESGCFSDLRRL